MFKNYELNSWFWGGLAVLLVILELLLGSSFFLLWLGAASLTVGVVIWFFPELSVEAQLLSFSLISFLSVMAWRATLRPSLERQSFPLNRRAEQYIGRTFTLSEAILNGRGKIGVDDSTWQVEGEDAPKGSLVEVIGVDGVLLKVRPLVSPS